MAKNPKRINGFSSSTLLGCRPKGWQVFPQGVPLAEGFLFSAG